MDKKAKNILFKHFWKNGWISDDERSTSSEDFQYAQAHGLMFEPVSISHDECIQSILKLTQEIPYEQVIKAFLSSLSRRRLDWRSGLASYFIAKQLYQHHYSVALSGQSYDQNGNVMHQSFTCGICRDLKYGMIGHEKYQDADLNVLNFERIKWGGVRHGELLYTWFDLKQFSSEDIAEPNAEDILIFKNILNVIAQSKPDDYPSTLEKNLNDVIKSSKDERQILLEIMACIDLLKPQSYDRPSRGKNDWVFVEYWRGEDKYNQQVVDQLFGKYLNGH
ncbi:hypothetical protein [Acinetobacter gerneri]|uniref:Uncharacterized protein n=1 Tax=Acinetobacter gerneri DSM 14967 = CIP 107464 = MTCC 9824 TaxID=1120926 RepID=N8Y9L0_9GAMM|nr:hypothetical protein [Acinetobacter gerneri]ENV33336.1 hypothetical protein F960_02363 [Acinetobacter gerneri DSM 14967 = CIP 107464 = MTCC 9824]EPR85630.1 hypothetical protein L289_0123 [Acinetobacter gerneri DSM 14967 = CIP 107464 = MTCC 9824]